MPSLPLHRIPQWEPKDQFTVGGEAKALEYWRATLGALSSMTPTCRSDGAITNAAELSADDVARQQVLWPEGSNAHAEHRCGGLTATSGDETNGLRTCSSPQPSPAAVAEPAR
jgi:hypothetical protein